MLNLFLSFHFLSLCLSFFSLSVWVALWLYYLFVLKWLKNFPLVLNSHWFSWRKDRSNHVTSFTCFVSWVFFFFLLLKNTDHYFVNYLEVLQWETFEVRVDNEKKRIALQCRMRNILRVFWKAWGASLLKKRRKCKKLTLLWKTQKRYEMEWRSQQLTELA